MYPDFSTTGFTGSTQDAAFFRVLSKGLGLSSRVCMSTFCYRIALLYIMFPFEKRVPRRFTRTAGMPKVSSEHFVCKGTLAAFAKGIKPEGQSRWQ